MSRTRVQQTQISGSLSYADNLAAGSELAAQPNLVGDLNALRSQLNKIIGEGNWYDALAGSQDLSDVYGAMHVTGADAAFQGDVSAVGDMSAVSGSLSGDLSVTGDITAFYGTFNADISAVAGVFSGAVQAESAAFTNNMSALSGSFGGDLSVVGDVSANNATLGGNLSAVDATLSGDLAAVSGSFSGNVSIAGDVAGRLYLVGADGEIKDESKITFSSETSDLWVDGTVSVTGQIAATNAVLSGDLSAVSGSFTGDVSVNGDLKAISDGAGGYVFSVVPADAIGPGYPATLTMEGSIDAQNNMIAGGYIQANGNLISETGGLWLGVSQVIDSSLNISAFTATLTGDLSAVSGSFSGDLSVTGDVSANDGSFSGDLAAVNAALSGDLSAVSGSFSSDLSVGAKLSIAGDTPERLYIVDADGSIKDEAKLTFDGSELYIDGDLKVGGNDIKSSTDDIAISLTGADVAVKGDLTVEGNEIKSTTGTVMELSGLDAIFKANVQVDGDLRVKGSMTYIDTQNMRVEDAFIYLATGSAGTTDSGIVLHGGAGASMDLVIGQDGGAGEVIFGKADRSPDGDGAMDGIALVPAWMSAVKLGGVEGAQSGSLWVSGDDVKLEAANNLVFRANGADMDLMSGADYTLFDSNFSATSIVGALNELYAAGAGGSKKGDLSVADVTSDVLDFSAVGTLNVADHKFVDVYLNGVLLSSTVDLTAVAADSVTLSSAIASELTNDDVLTVVLRGAA